MEGGKVSIVQLKQEKRRAEVLEKVMDLLKVKPFEDITIQDICQASGISVGSFYHYFKQKSELLTGLMGLIDFYMVDHVFPLLTSKSAFDNLKMLSQGFASFIDESGIELSKLISISDPTDYSTNNEKRPLHEKIVEIVKTGHQSKEFRTDLNPEEVADHLLVAMSGVAVDWSRRNGSYPIRERMEEFTRLFFPALLRTQVL
jgi:AcrR family transcriptional regulator